MRIELFAELERWAGSADPPPCAVYNPGQRREVIDRLRRLGFLGSDLAGEEPEGR